MENYFDIEGINITPEHHKVVEFLVLDKEFYRVMMMAGLFFEVSCNTSKSIDCYPEYIISAKEEVRDSILKLTQSLKHLEECQSKFLKGENQ